MGIFSSKNARELAKQLKASSDEEIMIPWRQLNDRQMAQESLLKTPDRSRLLSGAPHQRPEYRGGLSLGGVAIADSAQRPYSGKIGGPDGGDYAKMGGQSRDRMFDARMRPMLASEQRDRIVTPHKPPTSSASSSTSSDVVADKGYANNGGLSSLDIQARVHTQSSYGYHPAKVYGVTSTADRDVRPVVKPALALASTGSTVAPSSNLPFDWIRGPHLGHVTAAGHGSLSAGPPRAVPQQHEYSPPLDLSVKAPSGSVSGSGSGMAATKRRLTQELVATADDEPLDLSVKRPRKEAADESDDDVIVVGVHNAPSSADRVRPGVAQLAGATNQLRMLQPAPTSVGPHLASPRSFGYPAVAPPTGGMVHKPQQQQQQQPPQQLVVGDLSHYQSPRPAVPLACCLPAGQSRHPSPLPPAQSRHASPLPPGQSRHPSPLLRQTSPMNQAQRRSVSPMSPSLSPSTRSRLPSPLSSPHMRQATRDVRQGVPLVWSFEHGKLKPDAKHISNTHSSSSPSSVVGGPAKPPRDSLEYQRVIRDPERGLESRVGPPETYQGPCGQERHIQRIDKHQELVLGYEKPVVPAITKQQPMGLSSGAPWIGGSGTGISVGAEGYMGQKSPSCQASTSPLGKTMKTPPEVLIQKDGDRPESKDRPPVYLDHPGAPVQFGSKPMPYSRPVSGLSSSQQDAGQNGHAVPVPRTSGVANKPAVQQAYGMTVSDIPKFKVTMQGNKLYQQRTPDRPYPDQLSSAPAPSTVEEPVRLSQQNGCPVISVPIIKEENKVYPQSHPGPYGAKLAAPADDVGKPLKVDQKPIGGGSTSGAAGRGSDDAVSATGPGHAQTLTGTNMISKTESMFVNGPHKMIPVANVHPIRKLTSSIGPGAGKPDDSDLFHGESPEAKKADVKEETKKPEIPVSDVHQKIQKAPHPLYRSHQDEFVRFLSRSGASSPNTSRPGKKQLKLLGKSCADKIRNKLCAGPEGADDLRSDLELVRRDLALHFSTPKGRHKLLAAKNSPAFVQEFVASLAGSGLDGLREQSGQVTDVPSSQSQDKSSDTSPPAVKTEPEEDKECQRKKTKGSGTKRRKPAGRDGGDTPACRPEQPTDRVPCKKRKRRRIPEDDPDELFDDEDDDDDEVYVLPLDDVDSSDAREDNVTPRRRHLTDKRARREEQRSNRGEKRPYRRKTQRMVTRPEDGADSPRLRRKERGRSRSSRIRAALRKSRRATLYDKNAAYEAELRKEEERRLLRRVKREERCQIVITPSDNTDDVQLATGETAADGGELQDASCDDGQVEEARRALRSTKQLGRSMRRSRQLSLKGRVSSQKGHLLRDPRFPAEAIVELHPLRMRNKVKARRLPSEKVNKRKKEGRSCTRPLTETPDKKRLFVCRETGETTLHKAARKGYVDAALQCLDSELVDINVRDNAGYTPLHESCVSGSLAIARALIARGADANVKALDGTRPLHDAVDNNHIELVRLLLSQGADPTIANYGGRTPLKLARSPMMKTFMSDYLADLRDDGPDWEVPPYTGRQGDELGFDIVAGAPDADGFDPGQEVFFDMCSDLFLPMFYLRVDKNTGPRNYHLVRDVSRRLGQGNQDDFMLLNGDLHFVEVSKSTVVEQLRANPLCAADLRHLDDVGDSVQLVEIDSTLCQLLEVSREPLRAEVSESSTTSEEIIEPSDPDLEEKTNQANPEEGPSLPDTGMSPALTSPPKPSVRDKKRPSNMRKSKSCTSLDMCDVNKMTINQLTALNRSESSPNVQNAPALKSNNNNNRNNNNNNANNTNGCCTFGFNPYAKDKKLTAKKRTELFGSPAKTKLGRHLDRAVLCNEMTALAREVTRTVLAREVNKKVRLSKRFAGGGVSSTNSPCVLVASSSSTSYGSSQPPVTFTPKSTKVADQHRHSYVINELNSVASSCRAASSCDRSQLARKADGTAEPVNGVLRAVDDPDGVDAPDCGDVCGVMVVVAGDGGRIEHAISAGDGADPDDGASPDRERSRPAERPAPDSARCPTGSAGGATVAHDGATVATANNTATTATTTTGSSTTTSSELALPVLENPFEEEAKQVPSVTNEGSNLEDREMPELTLCTY